MLKLRTILLTLLIGASSVFASSPAPAWPGFSYVVHGNVGNAQAIDIECANLQWFWLQQGQDSSLKCGGDGQVRAIDVGDSFDIYCRPAMQPGGATYIIKGTAAPVFIQDGTWYCWTVHV